VSPPIVLPHPSPPGRNGSSSVERWLADDPTREAPAVDFGTRWTVPPSHPELGRAHEAVSEPRHWRVLWSTSTREMFAIEHTRRGEPRSVHLMGLCPSSERAADVVAALPRINALIPDIRAIALNHGFWAASERWAWTPPDHRGLAYKLCRHNAVRGLEDHTIGHMYYATRTHDILVAVHDFRTNHSPERGELDPHSGYLDHRREYTNDRHDAAQSERAAAHDWTPGPAAHGRSESASPSIEL
jgi:hypothetical protein